MSAFEVSVFGMNYSRPWFSLCLHSPQLLSRNPSFSMMFETAKTLRDDLSSCKTIVFVRNVNQRKAFNQSAISVVLCVPEHNNVHEAVEFLGDKTRDAEDDLGQDFVALHLSDSTCTVLLVVPDVDAKPVEVCAKDEGHEEELKWGGVEGRSR